MKRLRAIRDAWESVIQLGLGAKANSNPANWSYTAPENLSADKLHALYDGLWLVRAAVDKKPQLALKRGFEASSKALAEYARVGRTRRHPDGVIQDAAQMARLEGGALIVVQHEQGAGNMVEPLLGPGGTVNWCDVIPRSQLKIVARAKDPAAAEPDAPQIWEVNGGPRKGLKFHASRAVPFFGDQPSPTSQEKNHDGYWGASVIQSAYEDLLRVGQRMGGVDRLLSRASIAALKIQGLLESIAADENSALDSRLQILHEGVEQTNLMLLEKDEDYSLHNISMAGLDIPVTQALQMVAGAFRYPMTVLFGMSPAGLNATGESDMRLFDDEIVNLQTSQLKPAAETLFTMLTGTPELVEFKPAEVPSEMERATTLEALLRAYAVLEGEWGVVDGYQVALQLQKAGLLPADLPLIEIDPLAGLGDTKITLAPTDVARVITVNEARASQGLGPIGDERGEMTIEQLAATLEAANADPATPPEGPGNEA